MKGPGLLRRKLAAVGRFVGRRPGLVLSIMLLVTLAAAPSAVLTVHPDRLEKNLLKVLTKGMPKAEAFKRIGQDFGIIDRHFVLVEIEDKKDLPVAKEFADRLAELLAADEKLVRSARSRMGLKKFFLEYAYVYYSDLDEGLASDLAARFSDKGMAEAMAVHREALRTHSALGEAAYRDPLNLRELESRVAASFAAKFGTGGAVDREGYFVSADIAPREPGGPVGKALLVDIQATASAGDHKFVGKLMDHTRECVARARKEVFSGERAAPDPRFRTDIGGAYAVSQHAAKIIIEGIGWSALTSFVLIVCLFAVAYRRLGAFFFIGVPLAVPVIWTLGLAPVPLYLFGYEGRLSIIGGTFGAVLLGLGVDYAIHIYNRYISERAAGASPERAAEVGVGATGEGIVLGALTTVVAFLGMTLTDFRGFKEFGIMAGLGVFLTMVALLVCVPAALALLSRLRGERERVGRPFSFGLGAALRLVRARPWFLVIAGLLVLELSVGAMFADPSQRGVNFESDFGKMGLPRSVDTVGNINRRVAELFELDYRQISVIVEGDSTAEVLERTAEICAAARRSKRVRAVRGITDLVPEPGRQALSLRLAAAGLPLADLSARLDRAAAAAGLNPRGFKRKEAYRRFVTAVEGMAARIEKRQGLDVERLPDPQVRELAAFMFRAPGGGSDRYRTHTMISLHRYKGMESVDYDMLARELCAGRYCRCGYVYDSKKGAPESGVRPGTPFQELPAGWTCPKCKASPVRITNYIMVTYELKDSVRGDLLMVTAIVGGVVLIMLLAALRRPVFVLLALSPVIIGTACMLLVMKVSGLVMTRFGYDAVLDLNYINVLVFPVLIGIGVDNAVHLIIRARQDGLDISGAVTETGRALVLCSLTTMLGFLSLVTCPHWGIKSLGMVVAIGMGFVLLTSIFFVPAALELLRRRAARRAEGGPK